MVGLFIAGVPVSAVTPSTPFRGVSSARLGDGLGLTHGALEWHISRHSVKIRFLVSSPLHTRSHLAVHSMAIIVFIVLILFHFLGNESLPVDRFLVLFFFF